LLLLLLNLLLLLSHRLLASSRCSLLLQFRGAGLQFFGVPRQALNVVTLTLRRSQPPGPSGEVAQVLCFPLWV
jgi:hypothetical protein